jgi:tetratricopeptide (TPR) repeat protein
MAVRQQREFRRLLVAGDAAVADGRTVDAIEAFSGAVALQPTAMVAYLKRGDAHSRRLEFSTALRDLSRAHALDETAPEPLERLGDVTAALGRYADAAQYYRDYLSLDDRSALVDYKLALALYRADQPHATVEPLGRALVTSPRFAEAHYLLGLVLRDLGRSHDARRHLATAIELSPSLTPARLALAEIGGPGSPAADPLPPPTAFPLTGASADGSRSGSSDSTDSTDTVEAGWMVQAALVYAERGQTDHAARTLGRAARAFPDDRTIPLALGRVWLTVAEETSDRAVLARALALLGPLASHANATGETLALHGRALLLNDQLGEAETMLRQAIERLPVDARTFRDLAEAAARLGHRAAAREATAQYAALAAAP